MQRGLPFSTYAPSGGGVGVKPHIGIAYHMQKKGGGEGGPDSM